MKSIYETKPYIVWKTMGCTLRDIHLSKIKNKFQNQLIGYSNLSEKDKKNKIIKKLTDILFDSGMNKMFDIKKYGEKIKNRELRESFLTDIQKRLIDIKELYKDYYILKKEFN